MSDRLQVGAITSTHGIKGEVKVFPTTDDPKRFDALKNVILETPTGDLNLEIEGVKYFKQFVILKFKNLNDINEIEKYKGMKLVVTRENAVKLNKDEYFVADMLGAKVVTDEDMEFGTLNDIIFTGANDVYVVITKEGKEVLIPAIKQCILNVDVENAVIKVHLLDGLTD
ncbi:MAG: rimM [Clostridiales bacterium]|jgi:16S rRNA processing protein RimM|nr:rimM [Clostridiales bacterium]